MRSARDDTGAATIWLILLTLATAAMLALMVDGSTIVRTRSSAYAAAEAAARVAANQMERGDLAVDPGHPLPAESEAYATAAALASGRGMRLTGLGLDPTGTSVLATVQATAAMQVASVTGFDAVTVDATATAERRVGP